MGGVEAQARLAEAERLSATSRAASGWYARYLIAASRPSAWRRASR
jgi:hypothetical protein